MRTLAKLIALILLPVCLRAEPAGQITCREIHYAATLADTEARFAVDFDLEATGKGAASLTLFDGEVAVLPAKLPSWLRLTRAGNQYRLVVSRAGRYTLKLDLVAKIKRAEPWNSVTFTGPAAAIGLVTAQATGAEVQLLTGTVQESTTKAGVTRVRGFLGFDRQVAVRWQSKAAEVARPVVLTCETVATVHVTPVVVKYKTDLKFEILQGSAGRLVLTVPTGQALTKVQGDGVRDWQLKPDGNRQVLTVEFIKPVEKTYALTLLSEQTIGLANAPVTVAPPQPQVERETGAVTVTAEDALVETETVTGLRQVNAVGGALAAYQFYARPFALVLKLRRIEPVVTVADHVAVRLEEARWQVNHALTLTVEKAGVYAVELMPQPGLIVADVRGDGLEDWKMTAGKLAVTFNTRVLGSRRLDVQLEQAVRAGTVPALPLTALRVTGATHETAQIGAAAAAGLQLKTATNALAGVREIPVNRLMQRAGDETLAFHAEQADWQLTLTGERLAARITATVFNLVTIGDGLLGGSATIRYAILNQGVQEFRVKTPSHWKNVEFTGPSIRRKELQDDTWVIGLQEKAWGGYTLVVTYDQQFDPHEAELIIGGLDCAGVERQTGTIAITTAASLQIQQKKAAGAARLNTLDRIDETELAGNDRALITRPVLLAYRLADRADVLTLGVKRFEELPVLDAAADRTQLTTVLTADGQMLTQAAFLVKNNDRQFQSITLPAGADFWGAYVDNAPVKPELHDGKLLIPLPRRANRDVAFAVDLVYAQKLEALPALWPRQLALAAPQTDMQTTYAEWELFAPATYRYDQFAGTMTIARSPGYNLRDAWQITARFYDAHYRETLALTLIALVVAGLGLLVYRRRWGSLVVMLAGLVILAVVVGLLFPATHHAVMRQTHTFQSACELMPTASDESGEQLITVNGGIVTNVGAFNFNGGSMAYRTAGPGRNGRGDSLVITNGGQFFSGTGNVAGKVGHGSGGSIWNSELTAGMSAGTNNFYTVGGYGGRNSVSNGLITVGGSGSGFNRLTLTNATSRTTWGNGLTIGNGSSNNGVTLLGYTTWDLGGANLGDGRVDRTVYNVGGGGAPVSAATASGIRPIRIDIPRTGQRLVFTKVLNVRGEPLLVQARAMPADVYRSARRAALGLALLIGLALTVWQSRRARSSSLVLTVGLALAGGAATVGLLAAHQLHVALIGAVPVAAVAVGFWLARRYLRRHRNPTAGGIAPVVATLMVLLAAGLAQAGGIGKYCRELPANAAEGRVLGPVIAGHRYFYTANGTVAFQSDSSHRQVDADGNIFDASGKPDGGPSVAGNRYPFPGKLALSVVGKVNNQIIQLGAAGQFTAPATGELKVWFNDEIYGDNSGAFNVCVWETGAAVSPISSPRADSTVRAEPPAARPELDSRPVVSRIPTLAEVSISAASYTGTVRALDAPATALIGQFVAAIELTTTRENQTVPLFGAEVAVEEFTATPATVKLVREGTQVSVFVPRPGPVAVRVKLLVKVTGDAARREMAFGIPAALYSRVAVTLDEPEAQVEVPPAISFKTTAAGQQTTVEAVLGATEQVELSWTPRLKRAAEVAATVFCENATLVNFAGGVINVRTLLDYQVTQGELRQLRVAVPAGQRLLRVEGEAVRTWKLDGPTLTVDLLKGVTPSYRLAVETMQDELGLLKDETVAIPHALDVQRETGLVALNAADELSVSVTAQQDLQKVDTEEFTRVVAGANVASAYRFLKSDFKLAVRVAPVQPEIEAVVRQQVRVTTEQIAVQAVVEYLVKGTGVFTLRLAIPDGYRVDQVTGAKLAQWVEKPGSPRVVEVTLQTRLLGLDSLTLELVKPLPALPKSLAIAAVQPLDVQKLGGFVTVTAEEGVQVKTETFAGLSEVPALFGNNGLAFKLITGEKPDWKLTVATEKIESWVRAEVLNAITLSETLVSGRSTVRYEIQNAPTKEFRVRVPAGFRNVEVTGANIRRQDKDEATGEWRVELQNKVRGAYVLTVTWDKPWDAASGTVELLGVEVPGVERETGVVTIVAPARLRVTPQSVTGDLLRLDGRDLPDWAERTAEPPVLAYRYLRPGFKLGLTAQRFDEAAVLQALVDNVRLTTVVAEDGQMMTEMTLAVRNNARQYLEIALPPGTTNVWSAFVAGQPVRPCVRAGKLLLPMERSSGDTPVTVEVTYVGSAHFPKGRGEVALESPALDVPLKDAHWELYLPPDYTYAGFAGSMQRAVAPVVAQAATPVVRSYGLSDYRQEESQKEIAKKKDSDTILSNARRQLAAGDLSGANNSFNMARGKGDIQDRAEFKHLASDIKQGQVNQLIVANGGQVWGMQGGAQSALQTGGTSVLSSGANNYSGGTLSAAPVQQQAAQLRYDEAAAEQQVAKVQAAQEVTVAKTVPLRLNLPKRGVYLAFAQVLQTEPGKPMTIRFHARNDHAADLPVQIAAGVAGLVALWLVVTWTLRKRN